MMTGEEFFNIFIEGMKHEAAFLKRLARDLHDGPDIAMAYKAYAESLSKTVDELTDIERKQAWLNAVLE